MKIVIAPDSYKGSLSALKVAENIEIGIRKAYEEDYNDLIIEKVPMADGGEGTVQALIDATCGKIVKVKVRDPLFREVEAFYGILGDKKTAVIEMASASGLCLLKSEERNPMKTTTYGTGELIKDALKRGCRKFILGLGGSATNDGGAGMLQALGCKFLDKNGSDIGFGGEKLKKLHRIDISYMDKKISKSSFVAACDVNNPLCGKNGASYVFAPQKGADEFMVKELDKNLEYYASIIKKDLGIDIKDTPGVGAAGGLGAATCAFLKAELKRGIDIIVQATGLEEKIKDADLVITGEGMIDYQTAYGKTPCGVAAIAKKYGVPVIALAGSVGKGIEQLYDKGFKSVFSIIDKPMTLQYAMENADELLINAAERITRIIKI